MSDIIDILPAAMGADADTMEAFFKVADKVAANCAASNGLVLEVMAYALRMVTDEFSPGEDDAISSMRGRLDQLRGAEPTDAGATVDADGVETLRSVFAFLAGVQSTLRDEGRNYQATDAHDLRVAVADLLRSITGEATC